MHAPYPSCAALELAASNTASAARAKGIAVRDIALATTSEVWDKDLGVLVVYETDVELELRKADGTSEALKIKFAEELTQVKKVLPFDQMPETMHFDFESHENILRNYQGSYYLRLR